MSTVDVHIRARIDTNTKERSVVAAQAMGLLTSDAISILTLRIVNELCVPFDMKVLNPIIHQAMRVHNALKGNRSACVEAPTVNQHPAD